MSWLNNSVIYQIFIDRFAGFTSTEKWDEPLYLGGNIRGIIDKFDYIQSLGVDAIWLSPFFKGVAYHGYHITDFNAVDEHFGTETDIRELISIAHSKNVKAICDFVPNHCSSQHPYFLDAQKDGDSEYRNWFHFYKWPDKYECFLDYEELPKLNLNNPEVRQYLVDSGRKWLGMGFDGFRVDHVVGLSNESLRAIIEPLRKGFPNAVFIGEAVIDGTEFKDLKTLRVPNKYLTWLLRMDTALYRNYIGVLDGILDFETARFLERYALTKDMRWIGKIRRATALFGDKLIRATFLDNHDMERFLFRVGGDVEKLKNAAALQLSLKNPTIIYYGTEIGMLQQEAFSTRSSYADILARGPMEWDKNLQNKDLLRFYRKKINDRKMK